MAVVTEKWSSDPYVRGASGQRTFIVTDTTDQATAIIATGIAVNDPFPVDSRLRADKDPSARLIGPAGPYEVTWRYIRPEGGDVTEDETDPLDQPVSWSVSYGSLTEPSDVDANGNPITNTANLYLGEGMSADEEFVILTATLNQSTFDLSVALAHANRVNSDTVTTPFGNAAPGQLLCKSITPTVAFDINTSYVPVDYVLHIRKGRNLDTDGLWDAWKFRVLNVGLTGWWNDGGTKKTGPFVSEKGLDLPEPVRLNPNGTPIDTSIKVAVSDTRFEAPVAAPVTVSTNLYETTATLTILKFYRYPSTTLAGLPIFA